MKGNDLSAILGELLRQRNTHVYSLGTDIMILQVGMMCLSFLLVISETESNNTFIIQIILIL